MKLHLLNTIIDVQIYYDLSPCTDTFQSVVIEKIIQHHDHNFTEFEMFSSRLTALTNGLFHLAPRCGVRLSHRHFTSNMHKFAGKIKATFSGHENPIKATAGATNAATSASVSMEETVFRYRKQRGVNLGASFI